jgi:acyl-CoA synthetase (NDP forming)
VNPKGGNLSGQKINTKVEEIPGDFDLAAIFVNAAAVADVLEACRLKGAAAAEVFSSGFKEIGTAEGAALEQELVRIVRRGIRVIGPNCMGVYCPEGRVTILPGPDFPRQPGPVAFISQSGGQAIDFINVGKSIGLTFSKVVSFGNGADLRDTELLEYLGQDESTRIINMYIEGVADGDAFVRTFTEVAARKPVIVLKGGLSESGRRAVLSHTASMGGSRRIWRSILRQVNAVQVDDVTQMAWASLTFSCLPRGIYRNVSIISGGGGMSVAAADTAEEFGLNVPPFAPEVAQRIAAFVPKPASSAVNPVDMAIPFAPPQMIKDALIHAASDDRIDLQILITMFSYYVNIARDLGKPIGETVPYMEIADSVHEVIAQTGKPIVVVLTNFKRGLDDLNVIETVERARKAFIRHGIATFDSPADAMRSISLVNAYYEGRRDEQ